MNNEKRIELNEILVFNPRYVILDSNDSTELACCVNYMIDNNYVPLGAPFVTIHQTWCQAIYLPEGI